MGVASDPRPVRRRAARAPRLPGRRRPPRELLCLLVAVAIAGVTWALIVPAWQAPDEDIHFAYVQSLVERHQIPGDGPSPVSSAQLRSMRATNTDATTILTIARPSWDPGAYRTWLRRDASLSESDGGGPSPASSYPPVYYATAAIGYELAGSHANVLDQLYGVRLFSVLWLLGTTVGAWLLAGELTGRRRPLQLVAAACVGLWPMLDFVSASANPDGMMYACWTWSFWLGVRILRRGLTVGGATAFCAAVVLALLTKATSFALLPAAGFVLLFGLWRRLAPVVPRRYALAGAAIAVVVVPIVAWQLATHFSAQASELTSAPQTNWREFLSYLWQFYLPRLPFQNVVHFDLPFVSTYPAYNVWVATGWAAFGWVLVFFPKSVYPWFLGITVLIGVTAAARGALLVRAHRAAPVLRREVLPIAVFFALAAGTLVLGLHWAEFKLHGPTNQGRYLFPLAGLAGCAVALAVGALPRRWRPAGAGVVLAAVSLYGVACLGLVASHFYG